MEGGSKVHHLLSDVGLEVQDVKLAKGAEYLLLDAKQELVGEAVLLVLQTHKLSQVLVLILG